MLDWYDVELTAGTLPDPRQSSFRQEVTVGNQNLRHEAFLLKCDRVPESAFNKPNLQFYCLK